MRKSKPLLKSGLESILDEEVNCPSSRLLPLQTANYLISYENDSSLQQSAEELEDLGEIRIEKLKEVWTQVLERRRLYKRNTERVGTGL